MITKYYWNKEIKQRISQNPRFLQKPYRSMKSHSEEFTAKWRLLENKMHKNFNRYIIRQNKKITSRQFYCLPN